MSFNSRQNSTVTTSCMSWLIHLAHCPQFFLHKSRIFWFSARNITILSSVNNSIGINPMSFMIGSFFHSFTIWANALASKSHAWVWRSKSQMSLLLRKNSMIEIWVWDYQHCPHQWWKVAIDQVCWSGPKNKTKCSRASECCFTRIGRARE